MDIKRSSRVSFIVGLGLSSIIGCSTAWAGDAVRMFDHVPTVDELRQSLADPESAPAQERPGVKMRGITFGGSAAASQTGAAPAATSVSTTARPQAAAPAPQRSQTTAAAPAPRTASTAAKQGPAVGYPVQFDYNSDRIMPESRKFLDVIGQFLTDDPNTSILIEGHTDSSGSASYNLDLSERRAASVKAYLMQAYGVSPSRLQAVGMGKEAPLADHTPSDPINRRVQFRKL